MVPDMEFVKWLTSMGVGGTIAGLMFMFYRKDVKLYTDQWRGQSEALLQVVKENTAAVTACTDMCRRIVDDIKTGK